MHVRMAAVLIALGSASSPCAAEIYVADPGHTYASFETGHLGISWVRGRFNRTTSAKVALDRSAGKGTIDVVIDASSIDTGHEVRDRFLRSPDYFDVEKFPTVRFKSNQLQFNGETLTGADGELTMVGVTRPVSLAVNSFRCIQHPVNKREICGADASLAIKRSEWGIKRGATGIGDEVKISIQIEAYKESP